MLRPCGHRNIIPLLLVLLGVLLLAMPHAQYWFQSGARGGPGSNYNSGAAASIETVTPQTISYGSLGFWVGETLSNGAFAQMGYMVSNQTGYESANCTVSGCSGEVYIQKGDPAWFWEYFPSGHTSTSFYGGIGPNGSGGPTGTFNNYSLLANGTAWNFYFNQLRVGSMDLGSSSSGDNYPVAIAEYADAPNANAYMSPVIFKNLLFYSQGNFRQVQTGYADMGYGYGSSTSVTNPFGVEELDGITNYFEVGSGLTAQTGQLWNLGYALDIVSPYGNLSSSQNYSAYTTIRIAEPPIANITNGTRAVFLGWVGTGDGSYSGNYSASYVTLYSGVTERAVWQLQYYVNSSSDFGQAYGSGWYSANATAHLFVNSSNVTLAAGAREVFQRWSNGSSTPSLDFAVEAPRSLRAHWAPYYLVNATTPYQAVDGNGWYPSNTTAAISLSNSTYYVSNDTRYLFTSWSNGSTTPSLRVRVQRPVSLAAQFSEQYLVGLYGLDNYSNRIDVSSFLVNNLTFSGPEFLYAGRSYRVEYAHYKNVTMPVSRLLVPESPESLPITLPVYNVSLSTQSYLQTPINASLNVTFYNGSSELVYSGATGTARFADVPYGYILGTASYFHNSQDIRVKGGGSERITLITPSLLAVIIIAIVIVVMLVREYRARSSRAKGERDVDTFTHER